MLARLAGGLALVLALAALVPASAAARFQLGIQDDNAFVTAPAAGRAQAFNYAGQLGVTWLKMTLGWDGYHGYGLHPYDVAVNQARAHGWTVQLMITGSPWYSSRGSYLPYLNPSPGRFATFVSHVVRHFRGRVRFYSLWNEPNLYIYLSPHSRAPAIYHSLFRQGYAAAKDADPAAQVLIGEMSPVRGSLDFLASVLDRGGLVADGFAHHPYQFALVPPGRPEPSYLGISNTSMVAGTLRRLAREGWLRTPAGGTLPLYFTEFGYPRPGSYYGYFSEGQRAVWAVEAIRLARRQRARVMVWYQLFRGLGRAGPRTWDTGLLSVNGFQWPVYRALVRDRYYLTGTRPPPPRPPPRQPAPAPPPPRPRPPPQQTPPCTAGLICAPSPV